MGTTSSKKNVLKNVNMISLNTSYNSVTIYYNIVTESLFFDKECVRNQLV